MTSYSIDLKLAQQLHIKPNSNKYELPVDASDWESQMAKLVGFEEESPRVNIDALEADIENLQPYQL
jgi:hypothetical protein